MAYNKHDWVTGELITADKMNAIEEGIDNIDEMANDTLIESNFKGRTKYLKGIDIDSSSGKGTLIFYDGANKANESKIDFYTVESSSEQWKNLGFFTTEQGREYINQKFESDLLNVWTDEELKDSPKPVQNTAINSVINGIKNNINTMDNTLSNITNQIEDITTNKIDKSSIENEFKSDSKNPIQNQILTNKFSNIDETISTITNEIQNIKKTFNTKTLETVLWKRANSNTHIFKIDDTITFSDKLTKYDYIDVYTDYAGTESVNTFQISKNLTKKVIWIRSLNILDEKDNNTNTSSLSVAETQMELTHNSDENIADTGKIIKSHKWSWEGLTNQSATWISFNSESTVPTNAYIQFLKIVGRQTISNPDIDSIKTDIAELQEAVNELKENNNDSSN